MNTINLLSAISVLACNVSIATIPKQANSNDYGDIVLVEKNIDYTTSNHLTTSYGQGENAIDYTVYRQLGDYSDDRINFYTERYFYESSYNTDGQVITMGYVTFFTLDIYNNTLMSSCKVKNNLQPTGSSSFNVSGTLHKVIYNEDFNLTNLGNTLYFSNYNLGWESDKVNPKVAYCSDPYLSFNSYSSSRSADIWDIMDWGTFSNNFDNQHGSLNFCLNQYFVFDSSNNINISSLGSRSPGLTLTYRYYVNNPTYEVIDLPNVMLSILTMPFTFFSQAFNLTLFPNTPYALNVGHTILIIVGVIGTIYLIKYLVGIFKG